LLIDAIKPKGMLVKMHRFELILRQTSLQFGKSEENQIRKLPSPTFSRHDVDDEEKDIIA